MGSLGMAVRTANRYAGSPPLPGLGLKFVNTISQTVEWEEWHCDLGEKSAL